MRQTKLLLIAFSLVKFCVSAQDQKSILFVCEHGAARSVIAAAYFNKIANEKGLDYVAYFRGTDPQDSLTRGTKQGLTKDGFDISKMKPVLISKTDIRNATSVITFDCKLKNNVHPKSLIQWNGIPPISEGYDPARDQIEVRVKELVKQLQARGLH